MTVREYVRETEREFGFTYPPSFISCIGEFSAIIASEGFHRVISRDARLLLCAKEIAAERVNIPDEMIPFMRVEQPWWPDIYAFYLDSKRQEFRVVVWSDHAVVMDWESFPVFIQWIHEHMAKHDASV